MDSLLVDIALIGWAAIATSGWLAERHWRKKWQSHATGMSEHLGDVNDHLDDVGTLLNRLRGNGNNQP